MRTTSNLSLSVLTLFAIFAVTEGVTRAVYHPENLGTVINFDPALGWGLLPGAHFRSVDFHRNFDYRINVNSLGLRERDVTVATPPGRRRILYLGDSVTFGSGVDAQWRFSDFMGRALDQVETINAGVPGWGNDQELLYYETRGSGMRPDFVVLTLTLANDVVDNGLDHLFLGEAPKPLFTLDAGRLVDPTPLPRPLRPRVNAAKRALRHSVFLVFVKRRFDRLAHFRDHGPVHLPNGFHGNRDRFSHWSVFEKSYTDEMQVAWNLTEAIILRLSRDCRTNGAELIVFAFPLKIEIDTAWRESLLTHTTRDPDDFDFETPYRRLAALCSAHDIDFLYPLDEFRAAAHKRNLYFEHDAHPSQAGHAVAARVLLNHMNEHYGLHFEVARADLTFMDP